MHLAINFKFIYMKKYLIIILLTFFIKPIMAQSLKIISYNIHHGTDTKENDNLDAVGAFIKSTGADVVGLQEVDSVCRRSGNIDQMKRLAQITGMHYAFARHYAYDGGAYGLGILSKYPISSIQNNRLTLLKVTPGKKSLGLISAFVHLPNQQKVLFSTGHFALDAATRSVQADETIAYLKQKKIPVIFTGDLNAEPKTKEINVLNTYFSETDNSNLLTFPVNVPRKRIDYIFISKKFLGEITTYTVFNDNKLSDHLPILAEVKLKEK